MLLGPFTETLALIYSRNPEQGVVVNGFLIDCLQGVVPDWDSLDILGESLKADCKQFYALGSASKFTIRYFDGKEFKNILSQYRVYPKPKLLKVVANFFGFFVYSHKQEYCLDSQGQNFAKVGIKRVFFGVLCIFMSLWLFLESGKTFAFNLYLGLTVLVLIYGVYFLYWSGKKIPSAQLDFHYLEKNCEDRRVIDCLKRFARIDRSIYHCDIRRMELLLIGEMCAIHDEIYEMHSMRGLLGEQDVRKNVETRQALLASYDKTQRLLVNLRKTPVVVKTTEVEV